MQARTSAPVIIRMDIFTFAGEKLLHRLKRNPRPAPGTEVPGITN